MEQKLTCAFPGKIKPARVGVYKRKAALLCDYSFWDGKQWCAGRATPSRAMEERGHASAYQHLSWQGLTEDPAGSQS